MFLVSREYFIGANSSLPEVSSALDGDNPIKPLKVTESSTNSTSTETDNGLVSDSNSTETYNGPISDSTSTETPGGGPEKITLSLIQGRFITWNSFYYGRLQ